MEAFSEADVIELKPEPERPDQNPRRRGGPLLLAVIALLGALAWLFFSSPDQQSSQESKPLTPAQRATRQLPAQRPPPDQESSDARARTNQQISRIVELLNSGGYPPNYRYQPSRLVSYLNQELSVAVSETTRGNPDVINIEVLSFTGTVIIDGWPGAGRPPISKIVEIWPK